MKPSLINVAERSATSFILADAIWAFCMAFNVYLTLFRKYDVTELRKLEWKYCIASYGVPFIPSFVYLFIKTKARGKIYGSAIQWCWVRTEWGFLRIAIVFAPAWALIVLSATIYIFAGRKILHSRRRLKSLAKDSLGSSSMAQNEIDFPRATDLEIADEGHLALENGASSSSPHGDLELEMTSNHRPEYPSDPVHTGSGTVMSSSNRPLGDTQSRANPAAEDRRASFEANSITWTYSKVAMLFLLALLVTWIPPTSNRIYNFVNSAPNFTLSYLSALVVPLQGFWNSIIYVATSYAAVKSIFDIPLLRKKRATSTNCGNSNPNYDVDDAQNRHYSNNTEGKQKEWFRGAREEGDGGNDGESVGDGEDGGEERSDLFPYNTVRGYASAVDELWKVQISQGLHNTPIFVNIALNALKTSIVRQEHHRRREEFMDRSEATIQDGYTVSQNPQVYDKV
ncbi:hypothetical protein V501_04167 [Pseudogymnoascus sp. VKM F-4519 (FW-2642)]|nr:hypothetical protein V501_04167 [Pseudogymnoascus sp. VKM F-4519 (FW-2642)]